MLGDAAANVPDILFFCAMLTAIALFLGWFLSGPTGQYNPFN